MTWTVPILLLQLTSVPAGEAILKRVESALASVEDYTVTLAIVADLEQANIPPMQATLYFKKPEKFHVASESFALLPRDAFSLSPARIRERFLVRSVVPEDVEGQKVYRLQLAARDERMRLQEAWVEVNPERWTIEQGELRLAGERTLTLHFQYAPVGSVWLPSELQISFSHPAATAPERLPLDDRKPLEPGRGGLRGGSVIIRYSGYRLNTGLPDAIFPPSPVPAGR